MENEQNRDFDISQFTEKNCDFGSIRYIESVLKAMEPSLSCAKV